MITDGEFLLARQFDRDLRQSTDRAQLIINRKNSELVSATRIIVRLQSDLAAANRRAANAEAELASLRRQITRAALSQRGQPVPYRVPGQVYRLPPAV